MLDHVLSFLSATQHCPERDALVDRTDAWVNFLLGPDSLRSGYGGYGMYGPVRRLRPGSDFRRLLMYGGAHSHRSVAVLYKMVAYLIGDPTIL